MFSCFNKENYKILQEYNKMCTYHLHMNSWFYNKFNYWDPQLSKNEYVFIIHLKYSIISPLTIIETKTIKSQKQI